jgi:hypothetical protein
MFHQFAKLSLIIFSAYNLFAIKGDNWGKSQSTIPSQQHVHFYQPKEDS